MIIIFEKYLEVLSKAALFKGIEKSDLNSMLQCFKPNIIDYEKNGFITLAGSRFNGIGIILQGEAVVVKENSAGSRVMMFVLKPGNIFGEMIAFSSKDEWPASVQAQEACRVFFLERGKIVGGCEKTCHWHGLLIENMLRIISDRALLLNKKVEYLMIKSMRAKISTFLLEQYNKAGSTIFMLPMKRNELADYLNVSRPSMSREMCKMRDEGVIDFYLASVRIKDVDALRDMVNT